MVIPILMHSNAFLYKTGAARHPRICDVINDIKLFPTVYCRTYCHKFFNVIQSDLALQNQALELLVIAKTVFEY